MFTKLDKGEALNLTRRYKEAILPSFSNAKVYLFGSYAKDCARPESDIDVAVIVPKLEGDWLKLSSLLWRKTLDVDTTIEPVLIEEGHYSPLYEDIIRTGIVV